MQAALSIIVLEFGLEGLKKRKYYHKKTFQELFKDKKPYSSEKRASSNFNFNFKDKAIKVNKWQSEFNSQENNIPNILFEGNFINTFTSSKIAKKKINKKYFSQ